MSFTSGGITPIAPSASPATTNPINEAQLPASIRNGDATAKQAYQSALGFEQMLVNQLSQELASTAISSDGSSGGSGDGSSDNGSSGLLGSDPASSIYSEMLPGAMTSGIMSGGGTGMALELAKALDPAIGALQTAAASSAAQPTTGGSSIVPTSGTATTSTTTQPATGGSSVAAPSTVAASGGTGTAPGAATTGTTQSTGEPGESGEAGGAGEAGEAED